MNEDDFTRLYAELKQLGVKIDNLTKLFDRAAYGDGFARCAAQNNRLRHAEEGVTLCQERISGLKKWLVAGLVSVVSLLANFVWNVIQASLRSNA